MSRESKGLFYTLAAAWMAFILSFSIMLPLVFRPFYYAHIDALNLEETGFSKEEIITSYNEMMDYCFFGGEFSAGVMKFSESGASHFEDVGRLFRLDAAVLVISTLVLIISRLQKSFHAGFYRGHSPRYWAALLLLLSFFVIVLLGSIDFEKTFIIFHRIFFPGKTNWWFDPDTDQIILVLPQLFFRNCAILIVTVLFILCAVFIFKERSGKLKKNDSRCFI